MAFESNYLTFISELAKIIIEQLNCLHSYHVFQYYNTLKDGFDCLVGHPGPNYWCAVHSSALNRAYIYKGGNDSSTMPFMVCHLWRNELINDDGFLHINNETGWCKHQRGAIYQLGCSGEQLTPWRQVWILWLFKLRTLDARSFGCGVGNSHALQSVWGLPAVLVLGKITQREQQKKKRSDTPFWRWWEEMKCNAYVIRKWTGPEC